MLHKCFYLTVLRGRQSNVLENWSSLAKTAEEEEEGDIQGEKDNEEGEDKKGEDKEESFEWPETGEVEKLETEKIPDLTSAEVHIICFKIPVVYITHTTCACHPTTGY